MKIDVKFSEQDYTITPAFQESNNTLDATATQGTVVIHGINGDEGLSAYEIAVKNGFVGSEQEWLNSLRGLPGRDGKDGVSASHSWNGTTLYISSASGTSAANLIGPQGFPGADGRNGSDGKDGTPATHEWNGTRLTITSASGTSSADLQGPAGTDGKNGTDGRDGTSITEVQQTEFSSEDGGINIVQVKLSNGATSQFQIKNGSKGFPGNDGQDGKTPVKGVDYFTESEKQEVARAAAALVDVDVDTSDFVSKSDTATQVIYSPLEVQSNYYGPYETSTQYYDGFTVWSDPNLSGGTGTKYGAKGITLQGADGSVYDFKLVGEAALYGYNQTLATREWVEANTSSADIPSLDGYATQEWVLNQNYLIPDDLMLYAKVTDIPSLNGYATQSWVNGKLTPYATQLWVNNQLNSYATLDDIPSTSDFLSSNEPIAYNSLTIRSEDTFTIDEVGTFPNNQVHYYADGTIQVSMHNGLGQDCWYWFAEDEIADDGGGTIATREWVQANAPSVDTSKLVTTDSTEQTIIGHKIFQNADLQTETWNGTYSMNFTYQDVFDANGSSALGLFVHDQAYGEAGFLKIPELNWEAQTIATREWVQANAGGEYIGDYSSSSPSITKGGKVYWVLTINMSSGMGMAKRSGFTEFTTVGFSNMAYLGLKDDFFLALGFGGLAGNEELYLEFDYTGSCTYNPFPNIVLSNAGSERSFTIEFYYVS
jgi:hypothetical protein